MLCNSECPFYIDDRYLNYNIRFGGPGHMQVPACKLGSELVIENKDVFETKLGIEIYIGNFPIFTEECLCQEKRINKIKELLGENE